MPDSVVAAHSEVSSIPTVVHDEIERLQMEVAAANERARNLEIALQTNRRIGIAIGITMRDLRVNADTAFLLLRDASQRTNTKLRDVADEVIFTGTLASQ